MYATQTIKANGGLSHPVGEMANSCCNTGRPQRNRSTFMSLIGLRFAKALENGRRGPAPCLTRERVLVSLLAKRAMAAQLGADDMEAMLRSQIRWSLPMHRDARNHDECSVPPPELVD
jgi:hypothetical protein